MAHTKKDMTKLVIFDLDGTLLNTLEDIANACNYALHKCGCPEREGWEYKKLTGQGITNLFRDSLPEGMKSDEMVERMRSHFLPYYNEHKSDCTYPYDGIIKMLDTLIGNGIRLAVTSNKYQSGTEELVEKFLDSKRFITVLGQREGQPIKPDPSIVYEAMKSVPEISLDEIIYCGDSSVDMLTGINAGVRTIGVTWGFRSREELEAYSPWIIVDSPEEITKAVLCNQE